MKRFVLGLGLLALCTSSAFAQSSSSGVGLLTGLFGTTPTTMPSAFSDATLKAAPYSTIRSVTNGYSARFGPLQSVVPAGADYRLSFDRGTVLATIAVDAGGKITGLLFHDEESAPDTAALNAYLTKTRIDPAIVATEARSPSTIAMLQGARDSLTSAGGSFVKLDARPTGYVAVFDRIESHVNVMTDANGLITYIVFSPPSPRT